MKRNFVYIGKNPIDNSRDFVILNKNKQAVAIWSVYPGKVGKNGDI